MIEISSPIHYVAQNSSIYFEAAQLFIFYIQKLHSVPEALTKYNGVMLVECNHEHNRDDCNRTQDSWLSPIDFRGIEIKSLIFSPKW